MLSYFLVNLRGKVKILTGGKARESAQADTIWRHSRADGDAGSGTPTFPYKVGGSAIRLLHPTQSVGSVCSLCDTVQIEED